MKELLVKKSLRDEFISALRKRGVIKIKTKTIEQELGEQTIKDILSGNLRSTA